MIAFILWWTALLLSVIGGLIQFGKIAEMNHPAGGFIGWLLGNALSGFVFYCAWQYLTMP